MAVFRDLHRDAAALAQSLRDQGFPDQGRALENALAGGATGTEILTALRWTIKKLLAARLRLSPDLRAQAKALTAAIDDAFRP
jgi:hypothetical protein